MVLKQLFTHRLIRALRLVLPVVVIVLVAVPSWNYWHRMRQSRVVQKPRQLPKDLSLLTEGFTVSRTLGGRNQFTIHAKSQLGFNDRKNMLQDVDVTIFGEKESDPDRSVKSRKCTYDEATGEIRFSEDVEMQLDPKTVARTQELIYNHSNRVVVSSTPIQLERPGELNGSANSLEYSMQAGLLKLNGAVRIQRKDGVSVETDAAELHEKENWTTASGNVLLKANNGWVRGDHARADLTPVTLRPRNVVFEGNVSSESLTTQGEMLKIRAASMTAQMNAAGGVQRLHAKTNVAMEKGNRGASQMLTGNEMDAVLDASGKFDMVKTWGNARMTFGSGSSLESNAIWLNASGAVSTEQESVMHADPYIIEGRNFAMQTGDVMTFTTSNPSSLRNGSQRSSSDKLDATIDGKTNRLIKLIQTGHFQFEDGEQRGHAHNAVVEQDGAQITLTGEGVVSDSQMKLEATHIVMNRNDGTLNASEKVKTFSRASGDPILVTAKQMSRTADVVTYTGGVQFWRDRSYIQSDLLKAMSNNVFHAEGHVQSTIDIVGISAEKLDYDDQSRQVHYMGKVRARKQDLNIESDDLTVKVNSDGKFSEIEAVKNVVMKKADARGTGDSAIYLAATDRVTLTGAPAHVNDKEHGLVEGPRLIMNVAGDKMALVESEAGQRTVSKLKVKK